MAWACGIDDCGAVFETVESTVAHQTRDHEPHECAVCGTTVPAGFLAIRHVFTEHSRAEYVRSYGANSEEVRSREELLDDIDEATDVERLVEEYST